MIRPVIWDVIAQTDFHDVIRFIAADNPDAARRVARRIGDAAYTLGDFATGRAGRVTGTYEKPVSGLPYILVYEIFPLSDGVESITILHLIHTARDWPDEDRP